MPEYIDRDEALRALGGFPLVWEYGQGVKDCYNALVAVPVADAVPVVHARWVESGWKYRHRCSICGSYIDVVAQPIRNYCPNCGARMDLEDK